MPFSDFVFGLLGIGTFFGMFMAYHKCKNGMPLRFHLFVAGFNFTVSFIWISVATYQGTPLEHGEVISLWFALNCFAYFFFTKFGWDVIDYNMKVNIVATFLDDVDRARKYK